MTTPIIDYDNPFWVGPAPQPQIPLHLPVLGMGSRKGEPRLTAQASLEEYRANQKIKEEANEKVNGQEKEKEWKKGRPSLDPDYNPFLTSENPFLVSSSSSLGRGSLNFNASTNSNARTQIRNHSMGGAGRGVMQFREGNEDDLGRSPSESEVSRGLDVSASSRREEEEVKPTRAELERRQSVGHGAGPLASTSTSTSVWRDPGANVTMVPVAVKQEEEEEEDVKPVISAPKGRKRKSTTATQTSTAKDLVQAQKARPSRARKVNVKVETIDDRQLNVGASTSVADKTEASVGVAGPSTSSSTAASSFKLLVEVPVNVLKSVEVDEKAGAKAKGRGKGKAKAEPKPAGEVRQGRWRKKCPVATKERLGRVMDQRMFMLDRSSRPPGSLTETFKVLGSTGNVYTIRIGSQPTCDCPDARKGNIPCKHIIFVFIKVLKLAPSSELFYQKGLLDTELQEIFDTSPPVLQGSYQVPRLARAAWLKASGREDEIPESDRVREGEGSGSKPDPGALEPKGRKEAVGEDCPVCYEEMTEDDVKRNELVWDDSEFGCGKALHAECFRNWTTSLVSRGTEITCVWCRCAWPLSQGTSNSSAGIEYTAGGYMNIADLAGVNRKRDTSSYYQGQIRGRAMWEPRYEDD